MTTAEEQIAHLTQIIKANRLHEDTCVAFSTAPNDFAGFGSLFQGMAEKECHCWLDADNRSEEGKGFASYHLISKELGTQGYVNRHGAVLALLHAHPYLSTVRLSENHWSKTYSIVEVTIQPAQGD